MKVGGGGNMGMKVEVMHIVTETRHKRVIRGVYVCIQ
jgi:hypothetical protein